MTSWQPMSDIYQVYLHAIQGHVPPGILRTFHAFLDFCYLARRSTLSEHHLTQLEEALSRFHEHRQAFLDHQVREDFLMPRQHAMVHYPALIRLFGAPNGLCSSITESKHIRAVKEPWRRSSRNEALGQMLVTNQRLDQLAAARSDFGNRGMLDGTCSNSILQVLGKFLIIFIDLTHSLLVNATDDQVTPESDGTAIIASTGDPAPVKSILDEDPNDEIVNDPNVLAEVKLPSTHRKRVFKLRKIQFLCFLFRA